MKRYAVQFSAEAIDDLQSIWTYVAHGSGQARADRLIAAIRSECESLSFAPWRGTRRPQFSQDIRIIGAVKGRLSVIFRVGEDTVVIVGIHYAGRQHEPY